jgi:hypothetical protein
MFAGLRAATRYQLASHRATSIIEWETNLQPKLIRKHLSGQSHVETKRTVYLAVDVARYVNRLVYMRHE